MDFKLRFQQSGGRWSEIPIPEGDLKIGRRSSSDLQLHGRTVSREHAEIRRRGQNVWIADLGSTTGTWVDGRRLAEPPQKLNPGQKIKIGNFILQLIKVQDEIPTPGQRPGHVFISYSRADHELVYPFAQRLEADGFKVWIDRLDIPAGNPWRSEIVEAIAESDAFVLLLSPSSAASENVLAELNLAIGERIKVMPVILKPVQIPNNFKYQLSGLNRVDLFENPRLGYSQLTDALRAHQNELARQPARPARLTRQIEMILHDIQLKAFTQQKERELLNFLAQKTGFSPSRFSVAGLVAGSVRVTVNMPAEAAYQIIAQALNKDPGLLAAGISALRLAGHADFIHIGGPPPGGGPPPDSPKTPPQGTPGGIASMGGLKWLLILVGVVVSVILFNGIRKGETIVPPVVTEAPVLTRTFTMTPPVPSSLTPSPTRVTRSPSVTTTVTRTYTPTPSPTGSITPSLTFTPTPTNTPTDTPSITASYTPTEPPTLTPIPEFGVTLQPGSCGTFYEPGEYVEIIYGATVDGKILLTFFPPDGGASLHLFGIGGMNVSANESNIESLAIPSQPGTWVIQAELLNSDVPEVYCEFTVSDITPPEVADPTMNLYYPCNSDLASVDIFVNAMDDVQIKSVNLYYRLFDSSLGDQSANGITFDLENYTFRITIPWESGADFYIVATDNSRNTYQSPWYRIQTFVDTGIDYERICYAFLVFFDTDFNGSDLESVNVYDRTGCLNLCGRNSNCLSVTYGNGTCWLKYAIPSPSDKRGFSSGYQVNPTE